MHHKTTVLLSPISRNERLIWFLCVLILFITLLPFLFSSSLRSSSSTNNDDSSTAAINTNIKNSKLTMRNIHWDGGDPGNPKMLQGSCFIGTDLYGLCTPSLAIDLLIEIPSSKQQEDHANSEHHREEKHDNEENEDEISLLVVRRRDNGKFATLGGFTQVGESLHDTVKRECKEESGLDFGKESSFELFGIYSDPRRDKRRHAVSVAYLVKGLSGTPRAGDDAKAVEKVKLSHLLEKEWAFDHRTVIFDYLERRKKKHPRVDSGDTNLPLTKWTRSLCDVVN